MLYVIINNIAPSKENRKEKGKRKKKFFHNILNLYDQVF